MDIIYLLIPVTLVFILIAVCAFFWAVNSGQYDDLDSPAYLVLFDDENDEKPQSTEAKNISSKKEDASDKA